MKVTIINEMSKEAEKIVYEYLFEMLREKAQELRFNEIADKK